MNQGLALRIPMASKLPIAPQSLAKVLGQNTFKAKHHTKRCKEAECLLCMNSLLLPCRAVASPRINAVFGRAHRLDVHTLWQSNKSLQRPPCSGGQVEEPVLVSS